MAEHTELSLSFRRAAGPGPEPFYLTCPLSEDIQDAIPALDRKYSSGSRGQGAGGGQCWSPVRLQTREDSQNRTSLPVQHK